MDVYKEKENIAHLDTAIDHLKQHFDVVQIFVSKHNSDTELTCHTEQGCGNWWARIGQAEHWVNYKKEEFTRVRMEKDREE